MTLTRTSPALGGATTISSQHLGTCARITQIMISDDLGQKDLIIEMTNGAIRCDCPRSKGRVLLSKVVHTKSDHGFAINRLSSRVRHASEGHHKRQRPINLRARAAPDTKWKLWSISTCNTNLDSRLSLLRVTQGLINKNIGLGTGA